MAASWTLADGEQINRAHPDSFFIPPAEVRTSLAPGDAVRLLACAADAAGGVVAGEELWVQVASQAPGGDYVGVVQEAPTIPGGPAVGDEVAFAPRHVVSIMRTDEEWGFPIDDLAVVDGRLEGFARPPAFVYRDEQPEFEGDSGWVLQLDPGVPDEDGAFVVDLGLLADRFPALEPVFRSGAGTWQLDAASGAYRPAN